MRVWAILTLACAGFSASIPGVSAAELLDGPRVQRERAPVSRFVGCAQGAVWDGDRCVHAEPRREREVYVERTYRTRPVYETYAYQPKTVYVAPAPVYVEPAPVYVTPVYRPAVIAFYAGPRYGWGGHQHHRHHGWRR
jgi:hypothetical protein